MPLIAVAFTSQLLIAGGVAVQEQFERLNRAGLRACCLQAGGETALPVSNKPRITASPQAPVPLLDWAASEGVAPHQLLLCTSSSAERDAWRQGLAEQASPGSPVVTCVQLEDASSPSASVCSEPSAVALMPASVSLPDLPRAIAHHALASSTSPDSLTGVDSLTQSKARVTVDSMQSSKPLLLVATQMKASREKELQGMGLLQLVPQGGCMYFPLDLSLPLEHQLPFHALLHKASDELQYDGAGRPRFGPRIEALQRFLQAHPLVACIDPLECTAKVIDRVELARVCEALSSLILPTPPQVPELHPIDHSQTSNATDIGNSPAPTSSTGGAPCHRCQHPSVISARPPRCVVVSLETGAGAAPTGSSTQSRLVNAGDKAEDSSSSKGAYGRITLQQAAETALQQLGSAGAHAPYLVKPVVACGTPDSHAMALVLQDGPGPLAHALAQVRLPAVVQEFVNHGAIVFKVYVAGDMVSYATRPSIPDLPCPFTQPDACAAIAPSGVLAFDSLKSLPTTLPQSQPSELGASSRITPMQPAAQVGSIERAAGDADTSADPGAALQPITADAAASSTDTASTAGMQRDRDGTEAPDTVPEGFDQHLKAMAQCLGQGLGLTLFGFDIVIARTTHGSEAGATEQVEYVVIDVNYFPNYRGVAGVAEALAGVVHTAVGRAQGWGHEAGNG